MQGGNKPFKESKTNDVDVSDKNEVEGRTRTSIK